MIPSVSLDVGNLDEETIPDKTWQIDWKQNRIVGFCDRLGAVRQAISLILSVERFGYLIYPDDYGVDLEALLGAQPDFIEADIERRISEALLWDERITAIQNFELDLSQRGIATISFVAETIYGDVEMTKSFER